MAIIRARQRVITALHPHQANKKVIVPKRKKVPTVPAVVPVPPQ